MRSPSSRVKYAVILAVLLGCAATMLAATQTWFAFSLAPGSSHRVEVTAQGSQVDPALMALSLAGLAVAGILAITGFVVRIVLGVLTLLVGFGSLASTLLTIGSPLDTAAAQLTKATGIAGVDSLRPLVLDTAVEAWPFAAIAGAVLLVAAGVAVLLTARRWPDTSRRYEAAGSKADLDARHVGDRPRRASAVDDWDELSRGEDPTR